MDWFGHDKSLSDSNAGLVTHVAASRPDLQTGRGRTVRENWTRAAQVDLLLRQDASSCLNTNCRRVSDEPDNYLGL